jgi:hypothetical protein
MSHTPRNTESQRHTGRRIGAALAAGALLLGGAAVSTTAAQARPGDDRPSVSSSKPRPNAPLADRWLEQQVDRTVTEAARADFTAAKTTARETFAEAKEAAGADRDARTAAKDQLMADLAAALAAFDAATLPAEQLEPVTDYRAAIASARTDLADAVTSARAAHRTAKKEARDAYGAAREAATTRAEKQAANQAYREAQRDANRANVTAKKEARSTYRSDVQAARDALVAALV